MSFAENEERLSGYGGKTTSSDTVSKQFENTGHIGFGLSVCPCLHPFETCMPYLMIRAC